MLDQRRGPPDLVARKIADRLAARTGRPVVVENRPGASGTIAATAVAHAPPDGSTLLFGVATNLAVAPATMRSVTYDPVRDFTPVIEVASGPYVLLVRSDAPAADYGGFLAWAKANPGKLNYATPGVGSVHHLAMLMLQAGQGLSLVHVPYRSSLYPPLPGGQVQVLLELLPGPLPFLEAGRLRALALTGARRLARSPDVPTLGELGVGGLDDVLSWWGFVGPAGVPAPLVEQLNAQIRQAMADPELLATTASWGIELQPGSPQALGALIARENRRWREEVQRLGVAPE